MPIKPPMGGVFFHTFFCQINLYLQRLSLLTLLTNIFGKALNHQLDHEKRQRTREKPLPPGPERIPKKLLCVEMAEEVGSLKLGNELGSGFKTTISHSKKWKMAWPPAWFVLVLSFYVIVFFLFFFLRMGHLLEGRRRPPPPEIPEKEAVTNETLLQKKVADVTHSLFYNGFVLNWGLCGFMFFIVFQCCVGFIADGFRRFSCLLMWFLSMQITKDFNIKPFKPVLDSKRTGVFLPKRVKMGEMLRQSTWCCLNCRVYLTL